MGRSHDEFVKYPRTPHLFGSRGTDDDKHMGEAESLRFVADRSLIVEEKIDGTNVGIHFTADGKMSLQCRGHLITEGMHPQYDLFKQWAVVKRPVLEDRLEARYILFGEWAYARHSVRYRRLPHYFFEFDIYDKQARAFLDLARRLELIEGSGIQTVPVLHRGAARPGKAPIALIGPSRFDSQFENPLTRSDRRPDGRALLEDRSGRDRDGAGQGRPTGVRREGQAERPLAVSGDDTKSQLEEGADLWS